MSAVFFFNPDLTDPVMQSVAVYWVTSAAFGLVQTWWMEWRDAVRRRRLILTRPKSIGKS